MKERLDQLRATINHHNEMYFLNGTPEIPNSVYDKMFQTLQQLETDYPEFYDPNSPTARVGSDLRNNFPTVPHLSPMLSVNALETIPEVEAFIARADTICQLKYDGCGINLIYKNGKLHKALTRGDGYKGIDVTTNIRTIKGIPFTVDTTETIEIRGEVWCSWSELNRLKALGENVKSPVAVAINTIKVVQSATCALRDLSFTAFHVIAPLSPERNNQHTFNLLWLVTNHFDIPEEFTINKALRICADPESLASHLRDIPADGLIFKHDDLHVCAAEGANSRAVNWAVAYKFDKDIYPVVVAGISGKVAANNLVTPILFIHARKINNEWISKIPVTAADLDTGIAVGDTINIRRKGTRVAQLVRTPNALPPITHYCPVCSAPLIRRKSQLFCPNTGDKHFEIPAGENYKYSTIINPAEYSTDPAMLQYIARVKNCRILPVAPKNEGGHVTYKLYYNERNQLAEIGFAIGTYKKYYPYSY